MKLTIKPNQNSGRIYQGTLVPSHHGRMTYDMVDLIGPDGTVWGSVYIGALDDPGNAAWMADVYETLELGGTVVLGLALADAEASGAQEAGQ